MIDIKRIPFAIVKYGIKPIMFTISGLLYWFCNKKHLILSREII